MIVAAVEKLPLDTAVREHAEEVAPRRGGPAERHRPGARPPSAWSTWSTPTRPSGTPRRRWTGRTGPPTTAATSRSPRTAPAASGSGAAAPSRTPPCSRPPCCRSTKPQPAVDVEDPDCEVVQDPRDHGARMWDALVPGLRARAGHRPAPGLPRRPAPGHRHHVSLDVLAAADRLGHPRHQRVDDRRRPRARPLGGPAAGLRRRHHPRRPRHPRRGVRRRPAAPAGHPAALAGRRLPRPALRVPRAAPGPR